MTEAALIILHNYQTPEVYLSGRKFRLAGVINLKLLRQVFLNGGQWADKWRSVHNLGVNGCIVCGMIRIDSLQITSEILDLIADIDEFKGAWRALGKLAPARLCALRRVAIIESIGSSTRIEDSRLSDPEVERLLLNLQIKSFETRDKQEVAGYAGIMEPVFSSWQDIALTDNHIRQLHRDLLTHSEQGGGRGTWHELR